MSTPTREARSPRISDRTLARAQALSGLTFAIFLALHLVTALSAIAGQATYDRVLGAMRGYYHIAIVEIAGVLGAALVHAGAGLLRMVRRRAERRGKSAPVVPLRLRLHRYAGYYLLVMFTGHVLATRGSTVFFGHEPEFVMLHFSLSALPWWFYPYYAVLAFSGAYHLAHGVLAALKLLGAKLPGRTTSPRSRPFWAYAGVWAVLAVLIVLALGGQLFEVDTTGIEEWRAFWESLLP